MLCDDPNESSPVYLLTSDDEYPVCGTNFLPNQLLCRKYLVTRFFFVEETFDHVLGNEKDQVSPICRYRTNLGDFRHRRTMMLKVYINGHKTGENRGKELNNVWMNFSPTCRQKLEQKCRTASVIRYSMGNKVIIIFINLTGQNRSLSGLKNIWPVIMTGDLLSVILSLDTRKIVLSTAGLFWHFWVFFSIPFNSKKYHYGLLYH